jgi:two-component system cell cycle sensor histidine kinase/response regulator CckA
MVQLPSDGARRQQVLLKAGALERAILNSANFSSIATDAKGVIQIFNVGAERMLGYAAADVMNKMTPADISDPEEVIARAEALSVEFSTPITPGFEALVFKASRGVEDIYNLTYIRKDGSRFPAIVSVTALRDAQDAVIGYLLIGTDNTVRERAEAQLHLQGAALNAAANAIVITDDAGVIEWVNPAFSDLTGYAAAEAVGKNPRDLVKSDQHDQAFYKNLWDTILSGHVWRGETINRRRDGSLYTEEQTITPVRDSQGEIRHFIAVKQDITGRKRAEEAFRKGEEKLLQSEILNRSLVEHLPQRIFVKDVNSNYVFCNAVYARDLGIEPTQIVGKDDFAFFSKELAEAYRADDRRVMTDGTVRALDEQYTVTGEEQWIHTVKVPYRDEQGEIIGVLGSFEDISERKWMEAQRERLAALVEASPDFIGLADPKTTQIKYINKGGRRMCGIGEDEDIGKLKVGDVHPAWMNQRLAEVVLPVAARDGSWQGDGAFLHRDGREIPVSMVFLAHRGADGEVDFFYTVSRDITKWNQAVAALRTAEERMRFALAAADVGIWDMDYTTGVLRWSETMEAHHGLQPGTFGGTFEALVDRIHPDDRESALKVIEKAVKSGGDFQSLNRALWPDGTVRWLSGAGRILLGEHGEPTRGVGISQDVTARHALEEQFQQAQKMEAVGRLAGGVAHDFNNLLTVILGFCELLLADRDPDDPRQADIAEIQKAGTRGAGLTRQLLAFSRKQIIEPTLLDLNVVVADMRSMLGRLIGEDVKVVLGLGPELAPVKADRGQVEQVVMNLAVNAWDAMPKGGTLTIGTANVELDEHYAKTHLALKPGPYIGLTVTDTGTGMTPQVQARMFEPFFTTKESGKGTGLGMATVHGIVTASGGSVDVDSEVGKGTSFKVYFPRAQAEESVVVAPTPVNRRRAEGQTVLVVEDAEGVRELTRRLLQRQGYTVLVAANADEALRLFEQHSPIDLLLTDVVMPGASGPELTKRLVGERRALKVIYMSGYTGEAIIQHGVLKPGIAFLHKPFTSETLGQKIREVLGR